mmetsp:Transcript_101392/g.325814  ORF Transcript_101392/g.325814 Transcript_101392/m.325814 type:complete len:662 (+) Transcript_101392:61-2046(+)
MIWRRPRRTLPVLLIFACCISLSLRHSPRAAVRSDRAPVRNAVISTADVMTDIVDETAGIVRGIGNATAATLGATIRVTGGLARGLGAAVDSLGRAQTIERGPLAAPSRVYAGIFRVAGAVLGGVGSATIGLGSTVEGVACEVSRVAEDCVKIVGEPTRTVGNVFRRYGRPGEVEERRGRRGRKAGKGGEAGLDGAGAVLPESPAGPQLYVAPFFARSSPRPRPKFMERVTRRLLKEAFFGTPTDRMVMLVPFLTFALLAAWFLGRWSSSLTCERLELKFWKRWLRRGKWCLQATLLTMVLMLILRLDQQSERHANILQGKIIGDGPGVQESLHWLNSGIQAVWSPIVPDGLDWTANDSEHRGGLGAELANYTALSMEGSTEDGASGEVFTISVERVAFGDTPPIFGRIRAPSAKTEALLLSALHRSKAEARRDGRLNETFETAVVCLEADLGWAVDAGFEILVSARMASGVRSSWAQTVLPKLHLRLSDMILGPAPVAIAIEAAPQGYPYVGMIAFTFVKHVDLDFSVAPVGVGFSGAVTALPGLREAMSASLTKSFPLAEDDEVVVYDLGEWLAPGRRETSTRRMREDKERPKTEPRQTITDRFSTWMKSRGALASRLVKREDRKLHAGTGRVLRGVQRALRDSFEDLAPGEDERTGPK